MLKKIIFLSLCAFLAFRAFAITELSTVASFNQAIQNEFVVVDFFMSNCGPCKLLASLLEPLAAQFPMVQIVKMNVNSADSLSRRYNIRSAPTLIFFKNGLEVGRHVGCTPKTTVADLSRKVQSSFGL